MVKQISLHAAGNAERSAYGSKYGDNPSGGDTPSGGDSTGGTGSETGDDGLE